MLPAIARLFQGIERSPVPDYPPSVLLESTNACNLRCSMCHFWGSGVERRRETGFMKEEVWRAALDEVGGWNAKVSIVLHGAGEPLLHPHFFAMAEYAKKKPKVKVGFLNNGTLLTEEKAKRVLDLGIDFIGFSVDGVERDLFNRYRIGADLDRVEENIERFLSLREGDKPHVFLNMVALTGMSTEEFLRRWWGKVEEVRISKYREVGSRKILDRREERIACFHLYDQLVIGWDGTVVLCCEDIWADQPVGKIPQERIYDIWHGERYEAIRRAHETGRADRIALCKDCEIWAEKRVAVRYDPPLKAEVVESPSGVCYRRKEIADR
jgi:radical SAM protein with 4Fe4S-binding SPASM domain